MRKLVFILVGVNLLALPAFAKPEAAVGLKDSAASVSSTTEGSKKEKEGFRIVSINKDSIYLKLGLQEGDLIQRVDGKPIKDINDLVKLVQSLIQKGGKLKLKIIRNGKSETLDYNIEAG